MYLSHLFIPDVILIVPDLAGLVGNVFCFNRCVVGSSPTRRTEYFGFPSVPNDWVSKDLGMSNRVCATGHIKDPVPLSGRTNVVNKVDRNEQEID